MMTFGYSVTASCRMCGGVLNHITGGTSDGRSSRASVKCTSCGQKHLAVMVLEIDDSPLIGAERAELSRARRGMAYG